MSQVDRLEALLERIQSRRGEPRLVPVAAATPIAPTVSEAPASDGASFPPESPSEARRRSVPSPLELAVEVELDRPSAAPVVPARADAAPEAAREPTLEIDLDAGPDIDVDTDEPDTPTVPPPAAPERERVSRPSAISDLPPAALVDASVPPPAGAAGPVPIASAEIAAPSAPIARVVGDGVPAIQAPATFDELMQGTLSLRLRDASA
jgi:hypothetical protein